MPPSLSTNSPIKCVLNLFSFIVYDNEKYNGERVTTPIWISKKNMHKPM